MAISPARPRPADANLSRLYHALVHAQDIPDLDSFGDFGELATIAGELYQSRQERGTPGVLAIMRSWNNRKQLPPEYKRALTAIASGPVAPETPTAPKHTRVEVTRDEQLYPPLPEPLRITPEMTRGLCPLKDEYAAYSRIKSPEGFEEFHHSCFWAMVSTIAAHRVAIDLESRQYTALNVMLAARSTLYAKTETAEVERHVLKAAGLDWLLGLTRTTPQKLLYDMSGPIPENYGELPYEEKEQLKVRLAMAAQRGWHYNEFGKLMKSMAQSSGHMSEFIGVLLQISDGIDIPAGTIGRGNELVTNPYIAITGTLTPASIKAVASKHSELWSDGFLARMLWSCPPPGTFIDKPFARGFTPVPTSLSQALRQWHDRLGEAQLDIVEIVNDEEKGTGRYRKEWRRELSETLYHLSDDAYKGWTMYRSALKKLIATLATHDFDASYGRLSIMALRVAALAASLENANRIEYKHWLIGQEQAEKWRAGLHQIYAQVNDEDDESTETQLEKQLIEYMKTLDESTTARNILRLGPGALRRLKSNGLKEMLAGLIDDGLLKKERKEGSSTEWYRYAH